MSKYIYLGTKMENGIEQLVFKDKKNDVFYQTNFPTSNMIPKELIDDFEDYLTIITNATDKDIANKIYKCHLEQQKLKEQQSMDAYKEKQQEEIKKDSRFFKKICIVGAIIMGLSVLDFAHKQKELMDIKKMQEAVSNENQKELYDNFLEALDSNSTISSKLKISLIQDFQVLLENNIIIFPNYAKKINSRLRDYDFTNLNSENYQNALTYVLFDNNSILSRLFVMQLNECVNQTPPTRLSDAFGLLTLENKNILEKIFLLGEDGFYKELANHYYCSKDKIQELFTLFEQYIDAPTPEIQNDIANQYYKILTKLIVSLYKDSTTDQLAKFKLASQIFNGNIQISNNLFDEEAIFHYYSEKYGMYDLYYNKEHDFFESSKIYYDKLVKLIEEKGEKLDYQDPDSRFLFYLYVLSYKDTIATYTKELQSCRDAEELASLITNKVFDEEGFTHVDEEFLYSYFTTGKIKLEIVLDEVISFNEDAYSTALYIEYIKCLEEELRAGNITETALRKYKNDLLIKSYGREVSKYNEEIYNILVKHLENDESLFASFSIMPNEHIYSSEDIKKYILETKYD